MVEYTGYEAMIAKLRKARSSTDIFVMVGSSGVAWPISKGDAIYLVKRAHTSVKLICRAGEIEITGAKD